MSLAARCIEAVATGVVAADLPGKARAHVERRASAKRRASTDRHPAVKAAKERKRAGRDERRVKVAAIREAVFERAQERCEWCGGVFVTWGGPEMHHVISGSGRRRVAEAEDTCAAICGTCHKYVHRNEETILGLAAKWARTRGFGAALTEIEKRLAKVSEARAAQRGTKP